MDGAGAAQEGRLASEISEDILKPRIFLQVSDSLWEHVHTLSGHPFEVSYDLL